MKLEELSRYDRATLALWARSHDRLFEGPKHDPMAEAAVHALRARLRTTADRRTIFSRYEADTASDFALVGSLLHTASDAELLWRVRDAAFYLRWLELAGSGK